MGREDRRRVFSVHVCLCARVCVTEGGSDKRRHGCDKPTGRSADGFHPGSGGSPDFQILKDEIKTLRNTNNNQKHFGWHPVAFLQTENTFYACLLYAYLHLSHASDAACLETQGSSKVDEAIKRPHVLKHLQNPPLIWALF